MLAGLLSKGAKILIPRDPEHVPASASRAIRRPWAVSRIEELDSPVEEDAPPLPVVVAPKTPPFRDNLTIPRAARKTKAPTTSQTLLVSPSTSLAILPLQAPVARPGVVQALGPGRNGPPLPPVVTTGGLAHTPSFPKQSLDLIKGFPAVLAFKLTLVGVGSPERP